MPSLTIENYVKAIYQLCAEQHLPAAPTGKIAEALEVSPGTVTSMLKTLGESGLAQYTPYEGARLTDAGRSLALRVVRRHRLIELFLVKTLQLSWDEVHEEAENMEHAVSDLLIDKIDAYLDFPQSDPHGDPIPKADGSISSALGTSLTSLPPGSRFRLLRVSDQSSEFLRFLSEAGLRIGAAGKVLESRTGSGVILVEVAGAQASLAHNLAERLLVEVETD